MLIRATPFPTMSLWDKEKIEDVPLMALQLWNIPKDDNDFSTFEVNSDSKKSEETNHVCLYMLVKNFSKFKDGIEFFFIENKFLENDFLIQKDSVNAFECRHVNLKNINYSTYSNLVHYTFSNRLKFISYTDLDIKSLLECLDNDAFNKLMLVVEDSKRHEVKKKIKNRFFKDKEIPFFD